jgi:hypothetical protein
MYGNGKWSDVLILWEEALMLHARAAIIDFAWMVFMYFGYNVRWALPGWGVYYVTRIRGLKQDGLKRNPLANDLKKESLANDWWKIAIAAWILCYPVINGLMVDGAAPRWTLYPYMEGRDILLDLLPLLFFTLCIERGKQALIWMALPRRMSAEKQQRRAFLSTIVQWWDTPARIAFLFGLGWMLYGLHVLLFRNALYNCFLLPFYVGFVLTAASAWKPRLMPYVVKM